MASAILNAKIHAFINERASHTLVKFCWNQEATRCPMRSWDVETKMGWSGFIWLRICQVVYHAGYYLCERGTVSLSRGLYSVEVLIKIYFF